jgi:hypothetical protein
MKNKFIYQKTPYFKEIINQLNSGDPTKIITINKGCNLNKSCCQISFKSN